MMAAGTPAFVTTSNSELLHNQISDVDKIAKTFTKSLTLSEPEAEQSFNDTSTDSYKSMNLLATAFVPTPKADKVSTTKLGNSEAIFFAPKGSIQQE